MSVQQIASIFMQPHLGQGQFLILPTPGNMVNDLTMGQIIKGRVLRHMDGNRYSIQFGREEQVVDSGVPLKKGELLYGRVVGLGEHVKLERIHVPQTMHAPQLDAESQVATDAFPRHIADQIVRLFKEYRADLSPQNAAILNDALRNSPSVDSTIYAGIFLVKLGIPISQERLEALSQALTADPRQALFDERNAIFLAIQSPESLHSAKRPLDNSRLDKDFVQLLADMADGPERSPVPDGDNADTRDANQRNDQGRGLAYELLNLQTDGAVRHRVATVPLVVNGALVELNIGLVDQRQSREDQTATAYRRLLFTLNTGSLGTIAVDGTLTGEHLQLRFHVEDANALEVLERHEALLRESLHRIGIAADSILHAVAKPNEMPTASWLAARSVIQNDCLDRWM